MTSCSIQCGGSWVGVWRCRPRTRWWGTQSEPFWPGQLSEESRWQVCISYIRIRFLFHIGVEKWNWNWCIFLQYFNLQFNNEYIMNMMKLNRWPNLSVSTHAKLRQGPQRWRVVSIRLGLRPTSSATSRSGHGGYCTARYSQSTAQATVRSLAREAVAAEKK